MNSWDHLPSDTSGCEGGVCHLDSNTGQTIYCKNHAVEVEEELHWVEALNRWPGPGPWA